MNRGMPVSAGGFPASGDRENGIRPDGHRDGEGQAVSLVREVKAIQVAKIIHDEYRASDRQNLQRCGHYLLDAIVREF
jgi:hypothetical protein